MGTIADKIEYLNETKTAIKNALINKGATISDTDTFRSYADKINILETDPELQAKTVSITTNGSQTITPDGGYDGLSSVAITTNVPPSNLVSNSKFNSNLKANTEQSWTIPATAQYAIITLIQSHDYTGASAVSGTPECTATAGTLTKKIGTYYESDNQRTHTYVWTLTNTTGNASTIKLKAYYAGGGDYGHRHAFASVVY